MPLFVFVTAMLVAGAWPATATTHPRHPRGILAPPAPTRADRAVGFALDEVGVPYRWGGESPQTGFDCSGLVRWAYGRVGIDLPHNSYALYSTGRRVPESGMAPGDILFFEGLGHVGIYVGRGKMVHAPQTGRNVEVVQLGTTNYGSRLIGARRVVAA
jgi:peptidoglycan DL-endopeptidase CwlO